MTNAYNDKSKGQQQDKVMTSKANNNDNGKQ